MKISIKIITMLLLIIFILSSNIFAIDEMFSQVEDWETTGQTQAKNTIDSRQLISVSSKLYNIFLAVGIAAAVIIGAILGIQFMTAGVDKKVEVKQALMPYIVSCIVIFGAFGIWKLVVNILKNVI